MHAFIKANDEVATNETEDRLLQDIFLKLKEDLRKFLFMKLKPSL